jgi:hypothetical protein
MIFFIINNIFADIDVETMIRKGGLLIIFLAVYAQTGLFFSFFFTQRNFFIYRRIIYRNWSTGI